MILHMSIGFEIGTAPSPLSSLMAILWRTGHIYRLPKSIVLGIVGVPVLSSAPRTFPQAVSEPAAVGWDSSRPAERSRG